MLLPILLCTLAINAQQTEDEVYIGKGKTVGNYRGPLVKPLEGQYTFTGTVVGICKRDCCNKKATSCTMLVKAREDSLVNIGTSDFGFSVPKNIIGRTITVEGRDPAFLSRERRRKEYQQDIQLAATGLKFLD